MARKSSPQTRIPPLRFHRPTQQFYVWNRAAKKRIYLGRVKHLAERRHEEIVRRLIADPASDSQGSAPVATADVLTVAEACLLYYERCKAEPKKPGKQQRDAKCQRAMLAVADVCGSMPADQFRGKSLELVQRHLVKQPVKRPGDRPRTLCRQYVNELHRQILLAWSWMVKEELVPAANLAIMREVPFLREQEGVRESQRVTPADPEAVAATLPNCHPTLIAMIGLQQLTGMRPGEICAMRRGDISTSPDEKLTLPKTDCQVAARVVGDAIVWLYVPRSHKTLGKRKIRAVPLGPRAQAILGPFLDRPPEAYLFSPAEAVEAWREEMRSRRATPVQPSQIDRSKPQPLRKPRCRYTNDSYARAVARAIKRTNKGRDVPIKRWSPNQLRHAAATEASERFDEATAAALIGHSGLATIKVYAEQAIGKAAAAAAEIG